MTTSPSSTLVHPTSGGLHLRGVTGASTVETPGLRKIRLAVTELFEEGGVVVVDGKPGVGKTFGTRQVLSNSGVKVCWADMPDTPKGKEANARVFTAVTGSRPPGRMTEYALTEETVDVLSELKCALVIDEAQNMTTSALRQIRYLYDRPRTTALFILIGSGAISKVSHVPELDSRVSRRVHVKELEGAELRCLLPELHPMFANTTPEVLTQLTNHARGNLRHWARVLEVSESLKLDPSSGITAKAAAYIIQAITGGAK